MHWYIQKRDGGKRGKKLPYNLKFGKKGPTGHCRNSSCFLECFGKKSGDFFLLGGGGGLFEKGKQEEMAHNHKVFLFVQRRYLLEQQNELMDTHQLSYPDNPQI